MIRIITTKKLKALTDKCKELEAALSDLKGQHYHLHQLYKGLSNKHLYEMGVKEDTIKALQNENRKLKADNNRLRNSKR